MIIPHTQSSGQITETEASKGEKLEDAGPEDLNYAVTKECWQSPEVGRGKKWIIF